MKPQVLTHREYSVTCGYCPAYIWFCYPPFDVDTPKEARAAAIDEGWDVDRYNEWRCRRCRIKQWDSIDDLPPELLYVLWESP